MTCPRCSGPMRDDLAFNSLMQRYGLPQRRAACLNAHSVMRGLEGVAGGAPAPKSPTGRSRRRDAL